MIANETPFFVMLMADTQPESEYEKMSNDNRSTRIKVRKMKAIKADMK